MILTLTVTLTVHRGHLHLPFKLVTAGALKPQQVAVTAANISQRPRLPFTFEQRDPYLARTVSVALPGTSVNLGNMGGPWLPHSSRWYE